LIEIHPFCYKLLWRATYSRYILYVSLPIYFMVGGIYSIALSRVAVQETDNFSLIPWEIVALWVAIFVFINIPFFLLTIGVFGLVSMEPISLRRKFEKSFLSLINCLRIEKNIEISKSISIAYYLSYLSGFGMFIFAKFL